MFNLNDKVTTPRGPGIVTMVGTVWKGDLGAEVPFPTIMVALDGGGRVRYTGNGLYNVEAA